MSAIQPTICNICEAELNERLKIGEELDFAHCPHTDTLAIMKTDNSEIVEWQLFGPLTRENMMQIMREVVTNSVHKFRH